VGQEASARQLAAGLLPWSLLAAAWVGAATAWPAAGPLLRTLPVEPALVAMAPLGAALPGFLLGLLAYLLLLGGSPLGALVMLLLFSGFLVAVGLLLALGSLRLRDLAPAVHPALRLAFFLTPVLYSLERLPGPVRPFLAANPLAPFFLGWRQALAEGQLPELRVLCLCCGWLLLLGPLAAQLYPRQAGRVAALA
jgi:ABC-type polysaccharide/polyol phosphate export permease